MSSVKALLSGFNNEVREFHVETRRIHNQVVF